MKSLRAHCVACGEPVVCAGGSYRKRMSACEKHRKVVHALSVRAKNKYGSRFGVAPPVYVTETQR